MIALEYILTLLLSQSYLAIKDVHLSVREKQLIRRELSAELGILNEFLKKKLCLENVGTLQRKKHGSTAIVNTLGDLDTRTESIEQQQQQRRVSRSSDTMRVNVVRRLHLQQKVHGSTPNKEAGSHSQVTFENITPIKRAGAGLRDEAEVEYFGLSNVKIVEADYLHVLSNMFAVVCHSEK